MKRDILIVCLIVATVMLFSPNVFSAKKVLTLWTSEGGMWGETYKKCIDNYNKMKAPDIEVKFLQVPDGEIFKKLMTASISGAVPEIFQTFGTPDNYQFKKYFRPLDDYLNKDPVLKREDFFPDAIEEKVYEGKFYAMPWSGGSLGLYWNKGIFKEVGLDPEKPPVTWKELEEYAAKCTVKTETRYERMGYFPGGWAGQILLFIWENGGEMYDPVTNKVTAATDPKVLGTFQWFKTAWADKYDYRTVAAFQEGLGSEATDPFVLKKYAMITEGSWHTPRVRTYAPDIDLDCTFMPYPEGGKTASYAWWDSQFIPLKSKYPDEAWEYLKWLQLGGWKPYVLYAYVMVGYKPLAAELIKEDFANDPQYKKFIEITANNRIIPGFPARSFYNEKIAVAYNQVMQGLKPPEEALKELQDVVQKEVDRILKLK